MLRAPRPDPELVQARLRRLAGQDPPPDPPVPGRPDGADAPEPVPGSGERPSTRALAMGAVLAVLVAGWLTWRGSGGEVSPTVITAAPADPAASPVASATGAATPSAAGPATVVVQVIGAVRRPGVVRLPAGSRVQDAVVAAGGVRPGRSTGSVNLARLLVDGEQVVVGGRAAPGPPPAASSVPGAPPGPVDLNLADAAALDTLPGVGPVTAAAILRWRDEHGGFADVEQLQEVDGIGPKTYAQLAPLVRVGSG